MKKKALLLFILPNVLVVLALAGMFVLSEAYPLRPGTALYKIQHVAEQWRLRLSAGEADRAAVALELAERRLADLALAGSERQTNAAAVAFDRALNEAMRRVEASPQPEQADLQGDLTALLGRAEIVLDGLQPAGDDEVVVATLQRQVVTLQQSSAPAEVVADLPQPVELSQAAPIPFLSQDIDHTLWPLTGGHQNLACEDCHQMGAYAGTPGGCQDCHTIPDSDLYADHFQGDCLDCHLVDSWMPDDFDHQGIVDCQSCHQDDSPDDHYAQANDSWWLLSILSNRQATPNHGSLLDQAHYDRCADCHTSTGDWTTVDFDHFGFTDCQSCHLRQDELLNHYPGQCSLCHTTADWDPLAFEHANTGECRPCHAQNSPADHYLRAGNSLWYTAWQPEQEANHSPSLFTVRQTPDSCANCHPDTEDWATIAFDHTGFDDCEACHPRVGDLQDHYAGPCANCHIVDSWTQVSFDHAGYTDCQSCHSPEEAHYPNQCSLCHATNNWQSVQFSHDGFAACSSCHDWQTPTRHYPGQCTLCHTTNDWSEIIYRHRSGDDCLSCHTPSFDHYRGQCSLCHNTNTWTGAAQPHSGLIACATCHPGPAPHYSGACANCHTTTNWQQVDFDHTNYNDCRACHGAPKPHYPAQCSACHNTTNWANYYVNHVALASCASCHPAPANHWPGDCATCHDTRTWTHITYTHYTGSDCAACHPAPADHWPGQCSLCHNLSSWSEVTVDHAILTDCASCHLPPYGHWPGQCSLCHGTSSWDDYTFNHTGYDNCKACHSGDRPASHDRGQCSQCHTTDSWSVPDTPTPTPIPPTPTPTPTPEPPTPTPEAPPETEATPTPGAESVAP